MIVLLSAGAAQSLAGSNTVTSDDIVAGNVTYTDIKDGAVGSKKVLDNSVTGTDVNESSLQLACPAVAPTLIGGLCVGELRTVDDQQDALLDCANEGLRLPSISEGSMISIETSQASGWTDHMYWDGAQVRGVYHPTSLGAVSTFEPSGNNHGYRCITTVGARP